MMTILKFHWRFQMNQWIKEKIENRKDMDLQVLIISFECFGQFKYDMHDKCAYASFFSFADVPFSGSQGTINLIPRLEDCGEPRSQMLTTTRIFGGSLAEPGEFPYMALLYRIGVYLKIKMTIFAII